jgi:hypothetical protein
MRLERVDDLGDPGRGRIMGEFDHDSASSDPDRGSLRCDLRALFLLGDLADDGKRCLRPTRDQLDVVKLQGRSSSILLAG